MDEGCEMDSSGLEQRPLAFIWAW